MTAHSEQLNTQDVQNETAEQLVAQEIVEPTEADVEEMIQKMEASISNEENQILESADERIEKAPTSSNIDPEKAESIFTGGFAERINFVKEKIKTLATDTKNKIKDFVSNEPEVIHFKDMVPEPVPIEEEIPLVEAEPEIVPIQNVENTEEVAETPEQKEKRELNEYLEKEVFTKFGLTTEDEEKVLVEAPEGKREILQRSFENSRGSLEKFYKMEVLDGVIDEHAVDKATKELTYNTLTPILAGCIEEIQPKMAELGIDLSPDYLGFTSETANIDELSKDLNEVCNNVEKKIKKNFQKNLETALTQSGEYEGITVVTEEQLADKDFMEQRNQQMQMLQNQYFNKNMESIGINEWYSKTNERLHEPTTVGPNRSRNEVPTVDTNKYKVRKPKEEITRMLETEKSRAEQTSFLCINIDANKFEKVLEQGEFRDIFSLSPSELEEMNRTVGRGDEFYMNQRKIIESALGVYDPDKPTVYGTYASENGIDEKHGGSDTYGNIFLKLKPSVKATFCEGDSMSGGNVVSDKKLWEKGLQTSSDWAEAAKARQISPEHAALVKGMNNAYKQIENQCGRGIGAFSYLEAHMKGLNVGDIESINIPKDYVEGFSRNTPEQGDIKALFEKLMQDPKWKDKINVI